MEEIKPFSVPLGWHPRRLHRHSGQASAPSHQGLRYGSEIKTFLVAPCVRSWIVCLAHTSAGAVTPLPPSRRQEPLNVLGASPCEDAKKAGALRTPRVQVHFQLEVGRVFSSVQRGYFICKFVEPGWGEATVLIHSTVSHLVREADLIAPHSCSP